MRKTKSKNCLLKSVLFLIILVFGSSLASSAFSADSESYVKRVCSDLFSQPAQGGGEDQYSTSLIFDSTGKVACAYFIAAKENAKAEPTNMLGPLFTPTAIDEKKASTPTVTVSHNTVVRIHRLVEEKKAYATLIPLEDGKFAIGGIITSQNVLNDYQFQGGAKKDEKGNPILKEGELENLKTFFVLDEYGRILAAAITTPSKNSEEKDGLYTYTFPDESMPKSKMVRIPRGTKFFYLKEEEDSRVGMLESDVPQDVQKKFQFCPPTQKKGFTFEKCVDIIVEGGGKAKIQTGFNGESEITGKNFRVGNKKVIDGLLGFSEGGQYFGPNTTGKILDNEDVLLSITTREAKTYLLGCEEKSLENENYVKNCPCQEQKNECKTPLTLKGSCFKTEINKLESYALSSDTKTPKLEYDLTGVKSGNKEDCKKGANKVTIDDNNALIETLDGGSVTETNCQQILNFNSGKIASPITSSDGGNTQQLPNIKEEKNTHTGHGRGACVQMTCMHERYFFDHTQNVALKCGEKIPISGEFTKVTGKFGEGLVEAVCDVAYSEEDSCLVQKEYAAERVFGGDWDNEGWLPFVKNAEILIDPYRTATIQDAPTKGISWLGNIPQIAGCDETTLGKVNCKIGKKEIYWAADVKKKKPNREIIATDLCGCQSEIDDGAASWYASGDTSQKSVSYVQGKGEVAKFTPLKKPVWNGICNVAPNNLCTTKLVLGKMDKNKKMEWASEDKWDYGKYVVDLFRKKAKEIGILTPSGFVYILNRAKYNEQAAYSLYTPTKTATDPKFYKITYEAKPGDANMKDMLVKSALFSNCRLTNAGLEPNSAEEDEDEEEVAFNPEDCQNFEGLPPLKQRICSICWKESPAYDEEVCKKAINDQGNSATYENTVLHNHLAVPGYFTLGGKTVENTCPNRAKYLKELCKKLGQNSQTVKTGLNILVSSDCGPEITLNNDCSVCVNSQCF
ncbi:hypothetical protein HY643_04055 [Candidatus Woesearchaeota archaeon]|nr:hypothetical protein [Candidatus Woesearchaeota archaeon]